MNKRPPEYYQEQWECWFSPNDALELVKTFDDAAYQADRLCSQSFRNSYENSSWVKGSNRKQFVEDILRGMTFSNGTVAQVRDYTGRFIQYDEGHNNFTLLKNERKAAMVWQSRPYKKLPSDAAIAQYLSTLPDCPDYPLFSYSLYEDHLPSELDAFFVIRFELDESDRSGATVGKIDVIVPLADCKNVYCHPCPDLRAYASRAIVEAEAQLQVELLEPNELPTPPIEDQLHMELRPEAEEE